MKIVYLLPHVAQRAGKERIIISKMNYMADHFGYDVTLLTYEQGQHPVAFPLSPKVRHIDFNVRFFPLYEHHLIKRLFLRNNQEKELQKIFNQYVKKNLPDIVITATFHIREIHLVMRCPYNFKRLLESHTDKRFIKQNDVGCWLYDNITYMERIASHVDLIVTINEEDAYDWRLFGANTKVITNMTHMDTSKSRCSHNNKRVVFVGRYSEEKGPRDLLRIWQMVFPLHNEWHLFLYGTGELENELRSTADSLGMNIHVEKSTDDVFSCYHNASILAHCSFYEPFGLVMPEAMSCGLPVVTFDCPYGPAKIITDGKDGFVVKNRDYEEYATKLSKLMDDEKLRSKMGEAAILSAQRYAPEKVMPQWKELFEQLLSNA